jgi:hypothetical protein
MLCWSSTAAGCVCMPLPLLPPVGIDQSAFCEATLDTCGVWSRLIQWLSHTGTIPPSLAHAHGHITHNGRHCSQKQFLCHDLTYPHQRAAFRKMNGEG